MKKVTLVLLVYTSQVSADPVQFSENGHWYDVIPFSGTWEEARAHAESLSWQGLQGHLASPSTASEVQFVSALEALVSCETDPICQDRYQFGFWLGGKQGANANAPDKLWMWESPNETVDWIEPWNTDEPNDWMGADENRIALVLANATQPPTPIVPSCIAAPELTGYSWWNDTTEDTVLNGYIIEYNEQSRSQWQIANGGNGHWYAIVDAPELTWEEARTAANAVTWQGMRGQLATFTSEAELGFVAAIIGNRVNGCSCTAACSVVSAANVSAKQFWVGGIYDATDGWRWITDEPWVYDRLTDPVETDGDIGATGYLEISDRGYSWTLTNGMPTVVIGPGINQGYVIEFAPGNLNDSALQQTYMEQGRQSCRDNPASCDISCSSSTSVFNSESGVLSIPNVEVVASGQSTSRYSSVTLGLLPECGAEVFRVTGGSPESN